MQHRPEPLLSVENLTVHYNTVRAVDGLSFSIEPGRTLAIVGESGSGKSTTAMAIMRLTSDGATLGGAIRLREAGGIHDLVSMPEAGLRDIRGRTISMIFQEPMTSLNPVMRVGDQIAEAVRLHQDVTRAAAQDIALDSLRRVRLTDPERKVRQYPHQLSGGMRQRVMIAMALVCRPGLLIADEPTTALDVTIQAEMLRLIRELQAEIGMAVIYITHDLGVVAQVADDVLVMRDGKMVELQPVADLFERPRDPYTRNLLAAVPVLGTSKGDGPEKFALAGEPAAPAQPVAALPPARPGGEALLEVRHLSKAFPIERSPVMGRPVKLLQALQDASFTLARGETLSIVGESGSGKSTLARALLQLVRPDGGSIRLNGTELLGLPRRQLRQHRADMQMVFQDPYASLNPKHSVGDLIAEPAVIQGQGSAAGREALVVDLLRQVGLPPDFASRRPSALSGGQRQRVCIARALSTNPSAIVLDEAVSALDVTIQAQIVNMLIDLQRQRQLSFIFISHDMGIVERVSHRVAVMQKGRIVEIGPKQRVLHEPAHPYTRFLLSAVLRPDPRQRNDAAPAMTPFPQGSAIREPGQPQPRLQYRRIAPEHLLLAGEEAGLRAAG